MKILQIDAYHYILGGAEKVMFNTAQLLRDHGHKVIFFSLQWKDNYDSEYSPYFALSKESLKGFLSPIKAISSYFFHKEAAEKLEQLLERERPDVAQIHLMWGNISPSILPVLKKHQIPVILTVHDYRMICPAYVFKNGKGQICEQCKGHRFWKCLANKCAKNSYMISGIMAAEMYYRNFFLHAIDYIDGFLFVSNFCRSKHVEYMQSFHVKKSIVLHNFSDMIDKTINIPANSFYFLYFGRLSHEKGILTLIRSFSKLENLNLFVVGSGTEESIAKDEVRKIGAHNISFLGFREGEELKNLIRNARFVIVPSEWYENNPMTIIESYSLSTPVIGAEIGGIPEIIDDGKTGFCFKSGDVEELKMTVLKAHSLNNCDYLNMRNNALTFATQYFGKEQYYNKLVSFYKEIIN